MNNDFYNPNEDNPIKADNSPTIEENGAAAPQDNTPIEDLSATESVTPPAEEPVLFADAEATFILEDSTPAQETVSEPPYTPEAYTQQSQYTQPPYMNPDTQNTATPVYPTAPTQSSYTAPTENAYYDTPVTPQPPKKKKKGSTVFLIILCVIIGLFAIGFFVLCGYVAGQHTSDGSTAPTLFTEDSTEPQNDNNDNVPSLGEKEDNEDIYDSGNSIELKNLPSDKDDTDKYTTQYAYSKVSESTIGIVCYDGKATVNSEAASQGTGIVITEDGYIATNSHVIGDSRTAYTVQVITNDGNTYDAKIVGFDSRTDLAVLKIDADNLIPAEFCDSDVVEVGQDVIAVGNPGGIDFQNSLTRGVVSALNRELDLSTQVTYIQTDAAINPGNSGGPLCNLYGQVIGINTAKISMDSYEGMGFAIPSDTVKDIVDDLMKQGYVSDRVRLGISGQAVTSTMSEYYNVPEGILISTVSEGGPCDGTDLQVNDIITAIDDESVASFKDVYNILGEHKPGDEVVLSVYRMDTNRTFEITVTLMADEGETQE